MVDRRRMLSELTVFFLTCSVLGWVYEVFLEVVVYRWGYSDRGVLFGPYCVIYGFGGVVLLLCLGPLLKKRWYAGPVNLAPVAVFVGIVVIATGVELLGSYVMEALTGSWAWDYTRFAFDFQGRIAPNPSLRFGLGGLVLLYLVWPLTRRLLSPLTDRGAAVVAGCAAGVLLVDTTATFLL